MPRFVDAYMPDRIAGFPFVSSPRWSTQITSVASGAERANQNWAHPLFKFSAPDAVQCTEDINAIYNMWMVLGGPLKTFALRDPLDFASRDLEEPNTPPPIDPTDVVLGVGDGQAFEFQLVRRYAFGGQTYDRTIYHPVVETVELALNALDPGTGDPPLDGGPYVWSVSRETGIVTIDPPPEPGIVITAGFLFDVEARFEADDSYDGIVKAYQLQGVADLSFLEVRPC